MPDVFTNVHRAPIILAAARNKLPAVYWLPEIAREGGLLSYGVDQVDSYRRAATYVDRILRGEKPGDLPVQFPTKFEMVVNRKTTSAAANSERSSHLQNPHPGDDHPAEHEHERPDRVPRPLDLKTFAATQAARP